MAKNTAEKQQREQIAEKMLQDKKTQQKTNVKNH